MSFNVPAVTDVWAGTKGLAQQDRPPKCQLQPERYMTWGLKLYKNELTNYCSYGE